MPTFAEFFAGIGLVRMGLERQGWEIAFANDISEKKYLMYKSHFSDAKLHFVLDDINKIIAEQIPDIDLATASFPCNDLSLAGSQAGINGINSRTFWQFIRILDDMDERKPKLLLIENVVGFLKSHEGEDLHIALQSLNSLGYSVDTFIIDAVHFVPQSRPRFFIVASLREPNLNNAALQVSDTRSRPLISFIQKHTDIQWNIKNLLSLPMNTNTLPTVLEDLPEDHPEWWSNERVIYLLDQMSIRHRELANSMTNNTTWSYGTVFRRMRNKKSMAELRVDGIAGCLRTPRGGSAKQILFKAGYGRCFARYISPRECARLMGADNYHITGSRDHALFGFGDAVCVPVISWVARHYLNPLLQEMNGEIMVQEQLVQQILM